MECQRAGYGSLASQATDLSLAPVLHRPTGPKPCRLEVLDVIVGSDEQAKQTDDVQVRFSVYNFADGKTLQSTWTDAHSSVVINVPLHTGQAIAAFEKGVPGMKVGGRRQLLVPPEDAYGASSAGPIPANATLIFVIDLISLNKPATSS